MIDTNTNTRKKYVIYGTCQLSLSDLSVNKTNCCLSVENKINLVTSLCVHIPLQLSVEHYHCRHAHKHEHKGINNGFPPGQGGCDYG